MDHRIPSTGAALAIVAALLSIFSFFFLNSKFDGPSLTGGLASEPYELEATFPDVENLPTKQTVLSHGVQVGKVTDVSYNRDDSSGTVTFTVEEEFAPIYRDATARIGERTILGDPFLDLERGHEATGEAESGDQVKALESVDFDEALDFLDADGRAHLQSLIKTLSEGASSEGNGERLNNTVGGLSRTLVHLRRTTDALKGQEDQIAGVVSDGSTVLGVLGEREQSLREIVGSGRTTLDALASNTGSLERGVEELPDLLESGRSSLEGARPLLTEARPLVAKLRTIAPRLRPVIKGLGPVSGDASAVISGLRPLRKAGVPLFAALRDDLELAGPVITELNPAVRNLVPLLQYLAPRANGIGGFFANLAGATAHGDSRGKWARFSMMPVPAELLGGSGNGPCAPEDDVPVATSSVCSNAYPAPNDALDPEPFKPGTYPRLQPFDPPPRP